MFNFLQRCTSCAPIGNDEDDDKEEALCAEYMPLKGALTPGPSGCNDEDDESDYSVSASMDELGAESTVEPAEFNEMQNELFLLATRNANLEEQLDRMTKRALAAEKEQSMPSDLEEPSGSFSVHDSYDELTIYESPLIQELSRNEKGFDAEAILSDLKRLRRHSKYMQLVRHKKQLLDDELMALIYWTCSDSPCHIKEECEWKRLCFHLANALHKMHSVLHFENKQQNRYKLLFHGSAKNMDLLSQEAMFAPTILGFSSESNVAQSFVVRLEFAMLSLKVTQVSVFKMLRVCERIAVGSKRCILRFIRRGCLRSRCWMDLQRPRVRIFGGIDSGDVGRFQGNECRRGRAERMGDGAAWKGIHFERVHTQKAVDPLSSSEHEHEHRRR